MSNIVEKEIEGLKKCIAFLEARLSLAPVDESEYRRALMALADGNTEPLNNYLQRGGIIPKEERRSS